MRGVYHAQHLCILMLPVSEIKEAIRDTIVTSAKVITERMLI